MPGVSITQCNRMGGQGSSRLEHSSRADLARCGTPALSWRYPGTDFPRFQPKSALSVTSGETLHRKRRCPIPSANSLYSKILAICLVLHLVICTHPPTRLGSLAPAVPCDGRPILSLTDPSARTRTTRREVARKKTTAKPPPATDLASALVAVCIVRDAVTVNSQTIPAHPIPSHPARCRIPPPRSLSLAAVNRMQHRRLRWQQQAHPHPSYPSLRVAPRPLAHRATTPTSCPALL